MYMYKKYIYLKAISTIFVTLMINVIFIAPLNAQFFIPIGITDFTITQPNNPLVGKPYGGGSGYFPIIKPEDCDIIIDNNDFYSFKTILENANYGDKIYVNDNLSIEIPAEGSLTIPNGVTLASGRGRNGSQGALIYHNEMRTGGWYYTILGMDQAEITGLRIRGPSSSSGNCTGILQEDRKDLRIHNCEIFDWPISGITLRNSPDVIINNNFIHDNQMSGYGYGISQQYHTNTVITYNIFNNNRHSIAASGETNSSYTAIFNLVLPFGTSHRFDMHGFRDLFKAEPDSLDSCPNYCEPCNYAGNEITIINNSFLMRCGFTGFSIKIRGIPKGMANINNNYFGGDQTFAVRQLLKVDTIDGDGCLDSNPCASRSGPSSSNNCYYWSYLDIESNHMNVHSNNYNSIIYLRQIDWGGDSEEYLIVAPEVKYFDTGTFEYGDFNKDGRTDILNQGYVSWSGLTEWELDTEYHYINPNHVIDFNGDGLEDTIRIIHPTTLWPNGCYP